MSRRQAFVMALLALAATAGALAGPAALDVWAQPGAWTKVPAIVLVAPEQDPRLQVAREAVDFWNRTFAEIGTPFRLGPVVESRETVPVSFSARSSSPEKVLIGIRSHRLHPMTLPNVYRNVVAHELGHAIGLGHNSSR
ncbi:MAG: hypothetical protein FJX73_01545 [Armatimonadetes bacterium]|nr:hypothetical protein [Armatimonadota bacterium]